MIGRGHQTKILRRASDRRMSTWWVTLFLFAAFLNLPQLNNAAQAVGGTASLASRRTPLFEKTGSLQRGSVIAIPDEFTKTDASGMVDFPATVAAWRKATVRASNNGNFSNFLRVKVERPAGSSKMPRGQNEIYLPAAAIAEGADGIFLNTASVSVPLFSAKGWALPVPRARPSRKPQPLEAATNSAACPGGCTSAEPQNSPRVATDLTDIARKGSGAMSSAPPAKIRPARVANEQITGWCTRIMKPNGTFGDWGQKMAGIILDDPRYRNAYLRNNSLGDLCPNFNRFSKYQRLQAWIWFFTSLGQIESGATARNPKACDPRTVHATRAWSRRSKRWIVLNHEVGYGIWAAEYSPTVRRNNGRGRECNDVTTVTGQARCAIDTMYDTQLEEGDSAFSWAVANSNRRRRGYYQDTYFGSIRRPDLRPRLMMRMKRFQACFSS